MMSSISAFIALGLVAPPPPSAAQKESVCSDATVEELGPATASAARAFLHELQRAVATGNQQAVAAMVHYPLRTTLYGQRKLVHNKAQFLNDYDLIFNKAVRSALKNQNSSCLGYGASGFTPKYGSKVDFMIGGSGEIWFNSESEGGSMEVTTVNP